MVLISSLSYPPLLVYRHSWPSWTQVISNHSLLFSNDLLFCNTKACVWERERERVDWSAICSLKMFFMFFDFKRLLFFSTRFPLHRVVQLLFSDIHAKWQPQRSSGCKSEDGCVRLDIDDDSPVMDEKEKKIRIVMMKTSVCVCGWSWYLMMMTKERRGLCSSSCLLSAFKLLLRLLFETTHLRSRGR